jgi:Dullard-like phosphatase family protein
MSSKYISSSLLPFNSNNSNFFSPIPKKSSQLSNYTNLISIKLNNNKYISSPVLNMNKTNNKPNKKTLVLDLDETLVHSRFNQFKRKSDIILNINVDGRNHTIHVLKRPFLDIFINEVSKYFDIIIFTASIPQYASALLDELDKDNRFKGRFFRQHCINNNGFYLKDIKQIGKDLKDIIIIDNNPASYAINEDNGLPILTWYDNLNDNELNKLLPLLKYLANVNDVRPIIKQIVNKDKNEINFDLVANIINNKTLEKTSCKKIINGGAKNIYNRFFNNKSNYNPRMNDENSFTIRNINNININGEETKYNNYINNGKYRNKINNLYKYNNIIDSLSNMTYEEIQNEGPIKNNNNFKNNNNYINDKNNTNNINKNNSILNRTKKLFNGASSNNDNEEYIKDKEVKFSCRCENDNNKNTNNSRSFTPNLSIQRNNNYYNRNDLEINKQFRNNINLIGNIKEKINEINESLNIFNHRNSKDIIYNGINNIAKINNYLVKNDDNNDISNYYLQSSQKPLLGKKEQMNNNNKYYDINSTNKQKIVNEKED